VLAGRNPDSLQNAFLTASKVNQNQSLPELWDGKAAARILNELLIAT
jgi:hypothetical protein